MFHEQAGKGESLNLADTPVSEFDRRFDNWVRWCKSKGTQTGRCFSAEGAYRSPQIWHAPGPRPADIDVPDAVAVNRAFVRMATQTPTYANVIKVLVFKSWMRPTLQAQILGTHWTRLDGELGRAKKMLKNILHAA